MDRRLVEEVADGVSAADIRDMRGRLNTAGVTSDVIAPHEGSVTAAGGRGVPVDAGLFTVASVQYDAVYMPGGASSVKTLLTNGDAIHLVEETYKHYKTPTVSA